MATSFDEFGNQIETVTAEELVIQQNAEFDAMGGADDDMAPSDTWSNAPSQEELEEWAATPDYVVMSDIPPTNSGTTVAGKTGSKGAVQSGGTKPGIRTQNPLGDFASYTYQISLYMITPDAYNAFITSGRRDISIFNNVSGGGGAYIIAQSGGINNTTDLRAPGFDLDYYIDDLEIVTATNGKESGTSSNVSDIKFKIYEPYGFSFVTKLKMASDKILQYSQLPNMGQMPNAGKQFFILGIKFYGYDSQGNLITDLERGAGSLIKTSSNGDGSFSRFYDIIIKDFKFKLDGKMTVYSIECSPVATQTGYGLKHGILKNDVTVTASTVKEALIGDSNTVSGLLTQLNQQQKDMANSEVPSLLIPNQYEVVFLGPDGALISEAAVLNKAADSDKTKQPMSPIKDKDQVNESAAVKSTPNNNVTNIVFKSGTPIPQCIQLLISQSSYIENALKVLYTTDTEPDEDTDSPTDVVPNSKRTLKWYNVSTEVINLGFDTILKDYAYKIRYIIQPYDTPFVSAVTAGITKPYYGPHKKYSYYFSGKNTEIINYEQSFDNLYFNAVVQGIPGGKTDDLTPVVPNMRQNTPRQGKLGIGAEAQNAYVNFLTDPGALAEAKVTILGDPDYLMQDNSSSLSSVYNQFYGSDGFTINANGGQVFIEIEFNEASDYDTSNGTMTVNDKLVLWKYPPSMKIKGLSYMVIGVTSNFRGGKFTQVLQCVINTFPEVKQDSSGRLNAYNDPRSLLNPNRTLANQGGSNQNDPTGSRSTGLKADPEVVSAETDSGTSDVTDQSVAVAQNDQASSQSTSPTGGTEEGGWAVADDDSSAYAGPSSVQYDIAEDDIREA